MQGFRLALVWTAIVATAWAAVVAATGGVVIHAPWFAVRSRDPLRPLLLALVLTSVYVARYRHDWRADARAIVRVPQARSAAVLAAAVAVAFGIQWGTFIAGGPDASGYVSQASMWVDRVLTRPVPEWARDAWWLGAAYTSAPVGYRPGPDGAALVPTYAPGLPLLMAALQGLGGPQAVFLVVPLGGGLAVWSAYLLGRRLAGEWTGAAAALLLLCSVPFLWFVIQPMSDVPATAFWTLALALACRPGKIAATWTGVSSAAAILVRPNLVPLAVIPAVMLLARREDRIGRLARFVAPVTVSAVVIATLNSVWYGSPLRSGYGSLSELYALERIPTNLRLYGQWLIAWQTPLIFVGFLAPLVVRATGPERAHLVLVTVVFPLAVLGLYGPYLTFYEWTYLRFLLPGVPAALVGAAAVSTVWCRGSKPRAVAVVTILAVVCVYGWNAATREGLFLYAANERRFDQAVQVARRLPDNAIFVSLAHSGTLNFYAGRDVLRWEAIHPPQLDRILADLRGRGHLLYFVGDPFEVDDFRRAFGGAATLALFTPPRTTDLDGVRLVDLNR